MFDDITDPGLRRRIRQHVIGREHTFFAVVQPGFEGTLSRELEGFGLNVSGEFIEGGVEFTGRPDDCYTACIRSRTASRIVMRIGAFPSHNFYELERAIRNFPWELYLSPEFPVDFSVSARKSMIYHSGKLREIFEREMGERYRFASEESYPGAPAQSIFLRNFRDICTVSIDASGAFLHRRGRRKLVGRAPLRETLAALILLEARVNEYDNILDPMCGSGVFSMEAASIFTGEAPNMERDFSFMKWPSFKEKNYLHIKKGIGELKKSAAGTGKTIICSDIDPEEIRIARGNIPGEYKDIIIPAVQDFFAIDPSSLPEGKTLIIINPPYGKRIKEADPALLFREIGLKLASDFNNCGYAVIAPGADAENALRAPYSRRISFMNGGIKAALLLRDL